MKTNPIVVGPTHPAWRSIDDDDWNGATFSNWLNTAKGQHVILEPSINHPASLVKRMQEVIAGATGFPVQVRDASPACDRCGLWQRPCACTNFV